MNKLQVPALTEAEVVAIAQQALQARKWSYDPISGLQTNWRGVTEHVFGQEGKSIGLWSVRFLTPAGVLDQESQFVEIDDASRTPLGILTGHNYFFW